MLKEGYTLMHEHPTIDLSRLKNDDANFNDVEAVITEFKQLYEYGVRNIIDVTNIGMGRNVNVIEQIEKATNIQIISATGFYQDKFLPSYIEEMSIEEIAQIMIKEINEGIDGTTRKAQIIGEIGTSKNQMTTCEAKVFEAAIIAHLQTGVKITTHTTLGTYAHEQVEFFQKRGVNLQNVMIGHTDLICEADYIMPLLEAGVYLEFDTIGKASYMPDSKRIELLTLIERAGYTDKICLSLDITRKSHLRKNQGIGYSYLFETFLPMCEVAGISSDFIQKMLVTNPQNFFKGAK